MPEPEEATAPPSADELAARVDDVIRELLEDSHQLPPDDLPPSVTAAVIRAGFLDGLIFLVDHESASAAISRDAPLRTRRFAMHGFDALYTRQ